MIAEPLSFDHIYRVYRVHPEDNGDVVNIPAAKFFLNDSGFHVLEDHFGVLEGVEQMSAEQGSRYIHNLARNSMYWRVANVGDIMAGHHPDLIQPVPQEDPENEGAPEKKPSRFTVSRGDKGQQLLEWANGKALLDGHEVGENQLNTLLEEVNRGDAKLAHDEQRSITDPDNKEDFWSSINKAEGLPGLDHLQEALAALKQHVAEGKVHPKVYDTLRQEVFKDSLTPALGNHRAHQDFLSRPRPGVHVHLDANSFGAINKLHGHHVGNEAIKALANGVTSAIGATVGEKNAKAFRVGGDEFRVHMPTHEAAAHFVHKLRDHLESIAPVGGTHHLSFSVGLGHTPEHAEAALLDAKAAKNAAGHKPGMETQYAASRVPGHEGLIPAK